MVGDVNITDVLGLGKLTEIVSKGIGVLYEPYHLKRLSKERAEQIKLSSDVASGYGEIKTLEYSGVDMKLVYQKQFENNSEVSLELLEASQARVIKREARRQFNIESTIEMAANEFSDSETVADEKLNQEWIDRYFNSIEDVTDKDLQSVWAKILADEIKSPNSFSLRTLEILRNMTTKEAELFAKIAKASIFMGNARILINNTEFLNSYDIKYSDILLLEEIGLLNSENSIRYNVSEGEAGATTPITFGNMIAVIDRRTAAGKLPIESFPFTVSGTDLFKLIDMEEDDYYEPLIKHLAIIVHKNPALELYIDKYQSHPSGGVVFDKQTARKV